jgi:hypothetical protein
VEKGETEVDQNFTSEIFCIDLGPFLVCVKVNDVYSELD